jgi:hypothetical protein
LNGASADLQHFGLNEKVFVKKRCEDLNAKTDAEDQAKRQIIFSSFFSCACVCAVKSIIDFSSGSLNKKQKNDSI